MERNSFVFYKDWMKAIQDLPNDIRLEIYESIIEYATTGYLPDLKPMAKIAFNFIKTTIDRDIEKYMSIVERNRTNGQNGGRPRNPDNPVGILETQTNPNNLDSDSDSVLKEISTNVDTKKAEEERKRLELDSKRENQKQKLIAAKAATIKRKEDFRLLLVPFVDRYGKDLIRAFFDYWTEPNKSFSKMKYETEKTWDLALRLGTWCNRELRFNKGKGSSDKPQSNIY